MHEAAATPAWVLLAYLISGVCFILALRGLSSPTSSRRGNYIGMAGMAIAGATPLAVHHPEQQGDGASPSLSAVDCPVHLDLPNLGLIVLAILIGGGIGLV